MTDAERAYAAGIFDGEGSVLIYRRTKTMPKGVTIPYQIRATMTNTNRALVYQFKAWFGGSVVSYAAKENRRQGWKWTVQCQLARSFYVLVSPYLRVKAAEAEVALAMQDTIDRFKARPRSGRRGQAPLPPAEIAHRDALHARLQELRRPEGICN